MRKAGWTPAVEAAAVPLMWLALASGLPKFGRAGVFRDQVFRVVGVPEDYFLVCFCSRRQSSRVSILYCFRRSLDGAGRHNPIVARMRRPVLEGYPGGIPLNSRSMLVAGARYAGYAQIF